MSYYSSLDFADQDGDGLDELQVTAPAATCRACLAKQKQIGTYRYDSNLGRYSLESLRSE